MLKIFGILILCQVVLTVHGRRQKKEYYSPDQTVHQNLRNVDPVGYLVPFKKAAANNDEFRQHSKTSRSTGPTHTYVKTDKNANVKWGVRHYVGRKYAR